MKSKLIVVDISSFIFRAHFAIRPMHTPQGVQVNAVYGVLTMLMKLLTAYQPTHIILARDLPGGSFRNEKYPEYKANRGAPPEELVPQFAIIENLINKMKIPAKAMPNYEADDVIGSLVCQFRDSFDEILIASGDKDLMQFVDDKIKMVDTMKGKTYGVAQVTEKMGVRPDQIVDYLSLLGDSSDNIPGVRGIGAKGAADLLSQFPTLDLLIENIDNITNKRAKTSLEKGIDMAHLSKSLVTIVTDLKMDIAVEDMKFSLEPHEEFLALLDELNFKSIKNRVQSGSSAISARSPSTNIGYTLLTEKKKYDTVLESLEKEDQVFIDFFFAQGSYHDLNPSVVSFSTAEKTYLFYPEKLESFTHFITQVNAIEGLKIITAQSKAIHFALLQEGIESEVDIFDITQAHFVLNPDKKHDLASICSEVIGDFVLNEKELGKEKLDAEQSVKNFEYAMAKRSSLGLKSYPWLIQNLVKEKLYSIYEQIDAPINKVLAKMEFKGIQIDPQFFSDLEEKFEKQIVEIETIIEETAGEKINLNSPKQVGTLLFDKLELPVIKKTKTGYSTDISVLETLAAMKESDIPALIIKHRELSKLQSTYVKTLPKVADDNCVIRTHFNQANASTGRLSSDMPNLQNIPVKNESGRKIREGFIARNGYAFVGADYSQVELRILAHLSGDEVMVKSFNNDEDIHAQTAAQIFNIEFKNVTKDQRSYAKAINFGLMYGQSSFGLSQMLGISPGEAKDYILSYFERFSKVKSYLDSLKEQCAQTGYTSTIAGRKRFLPEINSTSRQAKASAERMAINTPIQGTAADIIKYAMLEIENSDDFKKLDATMLLQVHDELIFEVKETQKAQLEKLVKNQMESVMKLSIPLKVDVHSGKNWFELK